MGNYLGAAGSIAVLGSNAFYDQNGRGLCPCGGNDILCRSCYQSSRSRMVSLQGVHQDFRQHYQRILDAQIQQKHASYLAIETSEQASGRRYYALEERARSIEQRAVKFSERFTRGIEEERSGDACITAFFEEL